MPRRRFLLGTALVAGALAYSAAMLDPGGLAAEEATKRVRLVTSLGEIVLELYPEKAPRTVENFLQYVAGGFYDGLIFHRVISGFMIQGGGFDPAMRRRPTRPPIPNESDNGLGNARGTVAMARTSDPHSATAQFFINVVDNSFLDRARARDGWGYCVFGRVVEGMDVVDRIRRVEVGTIHGMRDVPLKPVLIERAIASSDSRPNEPGSG